MRKSILLVIALVLTFALIFTACAVSEEKIIIRLAHEDPPDNQWGMGANHFAELVSEKTGGRVEVQIFDRGQLGHGVDNIQQLQTGALDMTIVGSDMVMLDTFFKFFDLPYLFRDREHAKKVLGGLSLIHISEPTR